MSFAAPQGRSTYVKKYARATIVDVAASAHANALLHSSILRRARKPVTPTPGYVSSATPRTTRKTAQAEPEVSWPHRPPLPRRGADSPNPLALLWL